MSPFFPYQSAIESVQLIRSGEFSAVELMEETLRRIEAVNPAINAFVALRADEAMDEARAVTERIAAGGDPGPLAGIPLAVKDMEDVESMVTSFGSVPYKNHMARGDSIQVSRLKAAGAIVVGKTNTPEFGYTGFTRNRLFGVTRNPWNLERTPGGSSGGSAAAIAAGMVPIATGSDAGGSIRIPASYSGCFGLKPSFGRIPAGPSPLIPMFHTTCMGPLTRSVSDAALYLDCTAGYHAADPTSLPAPASSYLDRIKELPKNLRIAFSMTLGYARVDGDVRYRITEAVGAFEQMGHSVEECREVFPDTGEAWSRITDREIFGMLHRSLERNRAELGRTLVAGIDRAAGSTMLELIEDQKLRTELNRILWKLFENYDLLLTPAMPTEPFAAAGPPPSVIDGRAVPLLGATPFTYPFNLSGHPAASVPAGFGPNGLPAGLQIVGPRYREDLVLQAAFAYEEMRPWCDQVPRTVWA
ncbi:MAG: amidase [Desulfobacterales bacterium]|nr:amidase [Desulfobacterales bacterium]